MKVNAPGNNQPIYRQLITETQKGYSLLDEKSQAEVKKFVEKQQHVSGAFINRAGNPDLYYSLFGAWLSEALKLTSQKEKLKSYIQSVQKIEKKTIDKFALLLIQITLNSEDLRKESFSSLLKNLFFRNSKMNPAYQAFLFLLSFDALYGKKKFLYFILKTAMIFYTVPEDVPCSFRAAWMLAKNKVGMNAQKDKQQLFEYVEEGKGFKAFKETENADMLSTAVALFALKNVGADLRIVAPYALQLARQNFVSGAFLSGDGDQSRDLEYTFYGLLTLGTLS